MMQVKMPEFDDSTFSIATPLLLEVENTSIVSSGNPFGWDTTSTEEIADPVSVGFINPELITLLSTGSTRVIIGADT